MKKVTRILMVLLIASMFAFENSQAQQLVVRIIPRRPGMTIIHRPHRPSPRHVWVDEEWTPARTTYAYHRGYWALPPSPGRVWITGHWSHGGRGFFWVPGHWQ